MKRLLAAAAALAAHSIVLVSGASAANLPPGFDDNPSVIEALAKARASGKPVILYFTEHDCRGCTALDGWLVRGDIRQAFSGGYHFSMVFGDDMVPSERERWRATYSPGGAPAWVVLAADGRYVCTANGGFANANAAMELHRLLSRAATRAGSTGDATVRPRPCNANALGL